MLDKAGFGFIAYCDHCSTGELDTDEEDFLSAVQAMKDAGWKITKRSGEWDHICPACQESGADDYEDVS